MVAATTAYRTQNAKMGCYQSGPTYRKEPRNSAISRCFWAFNYIYACIKDCVLIDPACGSGGFILTAMNYIFDTIDSSSRTANAKEILKRNVVHQLFGVDISPKLVKIAKANMLLGKDGHGGIEHANSLDSVENMSARFNELCGIGKPDIILTNPPFGSGYDLRVKEDSILEQYKIGHQCFTAT